MPKGNIKLQRALDGYSSRKRNVNARFTGVLGITTGGNRVVAVPGRPGFVWVRLRTVTNEVIQAYNEEVSDVYDLPVIVERDKDRPTRYHVVSRDVERYQNWPSTSSYLPEHGQQHSYNRDDTGTGGDVVWVYSQQFMPFLVIPSGTYGAGNVLISPGVDSYGGEFKYVGNTGTANLLAYKPTGSSATLLLIYLDQETGNFGISEGTPIANTITGTAQVIANLPSPATGTVGLAGIRLVSGTSAIQWANIYDVRPFFVASTSDVVESGAPTDAQYVTLALDGDLSAERVLVSGTDVVITDGGANGNVTVGIPTGTFSRAGHDHFHQRFIPVYDNNAFEVTGTALVFNDNLYVDVTGTFVYLSTSGTQGGTGNSDNTLLIYDDSVFKVTGTAISFDDTLAVSVTGSIAYVNFTGSSGAGHTIQDDDESFTQRTNLKFLGSAFVVSDDAGNDATVVSGTHCGTYQRTAEPIPVSSVTGQYWVVPDMIFASGSLAAFQDGIMQRVNYDYVEQLWVSGTYQYLSAPATGTVHMVMYGVPCTAQVQPPTGTAVVTGSADALLLENGDYILLESGDKILLE